jgi:hypothetical protein
LKEILIIRSVSFQQLDKNLPVIRRAFAPCRISILTHQHGRVLAEKYGDLDRVYVYPFSGAFRWAKKIPDLPGRRFDAIIIPVSNLSGVGFLNVLLFSLGIQAQERWICNLRSDLRRIDKARLMGQAMVSFMIRILAGMTTMLLTPFLLLTTSICLLITGRNRKTQVSEDSSGGRNRQETH